MSRARKYVTTEYLYSRPEPYTYQEIVRVLRFRGHNLLEVERPNSIIDDKKTQDIKVTGSTSINQQSTSEPSSDLKVTGSTSISQQSTSEPSSDLNLTDNKQNKNSDKRTGREIAICRVPAKFHKLIWIKSGQFLIVEADTLTDPIDEDENVEKPNDNQQSISLNIQPEKQDKQPEEQRKQENNLKKDEQDERNDDCNVPKDKLKKNKDKGKQRKLTQKQKEKLKLKQIEQKKEKNKKKKKLKKGKTVKFRIVHILCKPQIKHLINKGLWPLDFVGADTADEENTGKLQEDNAKDKENNNKKDEDEMEENCEDNESEDDLLFRNTNRSGTAALQDSESEQDE